MSESTCSHTFEEAVKFVAAHLHSMGRGYIEIAVTPNKEIAWSFDPTPDKAVEKLLLECDDVALERGDQYGLCDSIDNDGMPYPSQFLSDKLDSIRRRECRNKP